MSFLDKIIDEDKIADLLNKGCEDRNLATAHKYLETLIRIRGLEAGLSNSLVIKFGDIEEATPEDWDKIIGEIVESDQRSQIEELLNTERIE